MKKQHSFYRLSIIIIAIFSIASCQVNKKNKVLKLAHGLDPSHPVHKGMEFMADRLKEKSGGKLTIDIYPSGQLGSEQQCVELLQIGSLAITKVSAAVMESFTKKYKVLGLPYVFRSKEHGYEVLDGEIGRDLLVGAEEFWIRGLCFYDAGSRSFYTIDKPIEAPEDLDGLKIRVMKSITAMEMVKKLGGSPTPISYGELYTALQSGVVDGAENNPPSFYTSHHYEVCKHYSLDEHTSVPDVLIVSKTVWYSLSEQEQKWLQEAALESVPVQRKYWAESVEESLRIVQEAGVKIYYPNKDPFLSKVQSLLDSYREDPVMKELLDRIEAVETN